MLALAGCARHPPSTLILWAWERPEDLRFAAGQAEVGVQTGFIELSGDRMLDRGRHFPLLVQPGQVTTAVVHVQVDPAQPLVWTPQARARLAQAVLAYAQVVPAKRVQIDFEVRQSQRQALLDLLSDVRAGLPKDVKLSMTALASWCDSEDWLDKAPVDEIVPMLFRMGDVGAALRARLATGRDFHDRRCRTALAVSRDEPILHAPAGRRVYLFDPTPWSPADFEQVRGGISKW
jgi:hypothetical protein